MKNTILLILIFINFNFLLAQYKLGGDKAKTKTSQIFSIVQGQITKTSSWCGGMRPSDEYMAQLASPSNYIGKKIFFKKKSSNNLEAPIVDSAITDSLGRFKVRLPIGKYIMVDENRKDKKKYIDLCVLLMSDTNNFRNLNVECLEKYFQKSDLEFDVVPRNKMNKVNFNYHLNCKYNQYPCVSFVGMYPN